MSKIRATVGSNKADVSVIRFLVLVIGYVAISGFVFDVSWDRSILLGVAIAAVVHVAVSFSV
jgi:hypothetical protein